MIYWSKYKKGGGGMSEKLFVELNGKAIIVHTFWIEHYDGALVAKMKCVDESQKSYFIVFEIHCKGTTFF